jgi:hypothetical protein
MFSWVQFWLSFKSYKWITTYKLYVTVTIKYTFIIHNYIFSIIVFIKFFFPSPTMGFKVILWNWSRLYTPELEQVVSCHLRCLDSGMYKSLIRAAVVTGKLIQLYQTTNREIWILNYRHIWHLAASSCVLYSDSACWRLGWPGWSWDRVVGFECSLQHKDT